MSSSNFRTFSIISLTLAMVIGSAGMASAQFDPATDFTLASNPIPSAVWSYGYENTPLPNPYNLLTLPGIVAGLNYWQSPAFGEVGVFDNPTVAPVIYNTSIDNATYQPGEIGMHPGPNDQYGVVQFTAPANGQYDIHGTFEGLDSSGLTNTQVDLLWNNNVVASSNVIGDGILSDKTLTFGPVFLNAGDTLAFAVGGNPVWGSTGLVPGSASVDAEVVPEPSSLALLGLAIVSFAAYRLRKRLV
jgi:hypothetical protein